jgi:hypothetical protein
MSTYASLYEPILVLHNDGLFCHFVLSLFNSHKKLTKFFEKFSQKKKVLKHVLY